MDGNSPGDQDAARSPSPSFAVTSNHVSTLNSKGQPLTGEPHVVMETCMHMCHMERMYIGGVFSGSFTQTLFKMEEGGGRRVWEMSSHKIKWGKGYSYCYVNPRGKVPSPNSDIIIRIASTVLCKHSNGERANSAQQGSQLKAVIYVS